MLTNCLTVDTANLAREGNVKLVEQNKTCGDVAKEVTIWKILYGTSDLGENDADTVLEGIKKEKAVRNAREDHGSRHGGYIALDTRLIVE